MIFKAIRLALIQLAVTSNKADNLAKCAKLIKEAALGGANLVALPECFNSPYGISKLPPFHDQLTDRVQS